MDDIIKAVNETNSALEIEKMEPSKEQLEIIKNAIEKKNDAEEVINQLIKLRDEKNGRSKQ